MKFFNFFKTGLGITILVLLVLAIIIIAFNWNTIKSWWSDEDAAANGTAGGRVSGNANGRSKCVSLGGDSCSYVGLYVPCSECTKRGIAIS